MQFLENKLVTRADIFLIHCQLEQNLEQEKVQIFNPQSQEAHKVDNSLLQVMDKPVNKLLVEFLVESTKAQLNQVLDKAKEVMEDLARLDKLEVMVKVNQAQLEEDMEPAVNKLEELDLLKVQLMEYQDLPLEVLKEVKLVDHKYQDLKQEVPMVKEDTVQDKLFKELL